jgi:transposase InsO family protein
LALADEATGAGARLEKAAEHLGVSARTLQRWSDADGCEDGRRGPLTEPANKLSAAEREQVVEIANSPEYRDLSPKQIVPQLADEGVYVASESTVYRVLREQDQMAHRERSRPATARRPDEHVATGPNQVWAWDISYLPGPVRGTFFYLYLILDVWSRKIVGAKVYAEETSGRASQLFVQTCWRLGIDPDGLVLHSDNGSPMKGATMLATLQWLGVVPSFSRPRVSNDNAFAEASFRTLKYRPNYPSQPFASLEAAQAWVAQFVEWYNTEHRHSAIRYVTPDQRHYGQERAILEQRQRVYADAKARHPERWSRGTRNWTPVAEVRLNPGRQQTETEKAA